MRSNQGITPAATQKPRGGNVIKTTIEKKKTRSGHEYSVVTGNVFEALGLPDAGELLRKAQLTKEIATIKNAELTQTQVAAITGLD